MQAGLARLGRWLCLVLVALCAPTVNSQNQSTFKSGIDVTTLDVSVLGKNRIPVLGLRQNDFTVLVDGQPRPLVSFKAVELAPPPPRAATTSGGGDIRQDVVTNTHAPGRVLVILIDDGAAGETPDADIRAIWKTRQVAHTAIDAMGPDDVAAVLFTNDSHSAQGFTSDHARLKTAVDGAALFPGATVGSDPNQRGDCWCGLCAIESLQRIADTLRSLPEQRKVILDISVGTPLIGPALVSGLEQECMLRKETAMMAVFRSAQLANVTINTVDPSGLIVGTIGAGAGQSPAEGFLKNPSIQRMQFLQAVAENTGGRALVRNNDPERQVAAVLEETGSYYLLGVDTGTPKADGRFHSIKVRVNRPDVDVRARNGFHTPTAKEQIALDAAPVADWVRAIDTPFGKADIGLNATVAAFASADRKAVLAIALGLTRSDEAAWHGTAPERIDTVSAAFIPESGERIGEQRTTVTVSWPPADGEDRSVDVLSRLPVTPGRYELRLGARTRGDRTGSVHAYVEVPNFARDPLSLSGVILMTRSLVAPRDAFDDLLPAPPTARRTFSEFDHVSAFARIYQGGSRPLVPVTVTTHIVNDAGADTVADTKTLAEESFGAARAADHVYELPVNGLSSGEYLLRIVAAVNTNTVERTIRFKISN